MKLIGQYAPATRSQSLIGWLGIIVVVALLVLPALLCWLNYRWYPRIQGFIVDGNEFS